MELTKQELLRFKELNDKKKSQRLDAKEFKEWKGYLEKAKPSVGNDINWWNKYPKLMEDACNIVFNEIAGTPFETDSLINAVGDGTKVPVGMRITYVPTIGKSLTDNDAFNYQMRDLWLQLHRKYRGIGTYESSDLGIAIYCIMSFIREIARAERVYGVCSLFNARNRSTPSVILQALGVEPNSYTGDELADFRYRLNRIIFSAKRLCLPKGFAALDAYVTLNGSVFKDADNVRAQWYIYDTPYRVQFSGTALSTGSAGIYIPRTATGASGLQTFDDIIADLTADVNALLGNTDVQRMCSDLLAALGDNTVVLAEMPEDYVVEPVRDETRELQFHNATVCGVVDGGDFSSTMYSAISSASLDGKVIYQENNIIKQSLQCGGTGYQADANGIYHEASLTQPLKYVGKPFLNTFKEDVSKDDIMEMTRLTVAKEARSFDVGGTTYYYDDLKGYGLYIIEQLDIFLSDASQLTVTQDTFGMSTINHAIAIMRTMSALSKFDWHPVVFWSYTGAGSTPGYSGYFFDLDNYTSIDKKALSRIHDAAVLSSFKLESSIVAS